MACVCYMRQQSNCLNGLTETHLIRQNAIDALLVQIVQPTQSFELIFLKLSTELFRGVDKSIETFAFVLKVYFLWFFFSLLLLLQLLLLQL